jgi:hypothetical protein
MPQNTQSHLTARAGEAATGVKTERYVTSAVYEFRPLPGFFTGEIRRYADGQWMADDGEYDLAFINSLGAPICLYFSPGYQKNIIGSWIDGHWQAMERRHPRGNPWHYALAEGETDWGGDWGRDGHENERAGRNGMDKLCSEVRGANGRHVEPTKMNDPHILAGLVRNRETGALLVPPREPICMYCGDKYIAPGTVQTTQPRSNLPEGTP